MKALIFAAGLGTRLRPITDTMPKALVQVGGVPMLERVLLKLKSAGIESFVINAHHFAEQIIDFIKAKDSFGCEVKISWEKEIPLET
ncbi:MAG: NTP transferase domain-containing protein, partial [Bacteroidales bacterium]|nr:NTP transferase domain-containing protein [Bacteroidales bacterium]